jgi:hypothetical protein
MPFHRMFLHLLSVVVDNAIVLGVIFLSFILKNFLLLIVIFIDSLNIILHIAILLNATVPNVLTLTKPNQIFISKTFFVFFFFLNKRFLVTDVLKHVFL